MDLRGQRFKWPKLTLRWAILSSSLRPTCEDTWDEGKKKRELYWPLHRNCPHLNHVHGRGLTAMRGSKRGASHMTMPAASQTSMTEIDRGYAWVRLAVSVLIGTIGGVAMWSVAVVLPAVQAEFGVTRGAASLPYTLTMLGLAFGGIFMGRLADKRGIATPLTLGAIMLAVGYIAGSLVQSMWQFVLVQGLLIGGLGGASAFGPLVADISLWFVKRRGMAVALVASGNYIAGAVWPPLLTAAIEAYGWRQTYVGVGLFCVITILPLVLLMRRPPPPQPAPLQAVSMPGGTNSARPLGFKPGSLQALLMFAGLACCVGMSMPQVHAVAYCGDLGYGLKAGAQMLSLMFIGGVISRLVSGYMSDKIGGLYTLAIGSSMQALMLMLFLPFDGLTELYVISALFGLAQGGIVPSYAIIVRDLYPASEAGTRVSAVLMSTVAGMAVGGWLSGLIYDLSGGYQAAFLNGIAWNILNVIIALELIRRSMGRGARATPVTV
jgi:MFS family permease